MTLPLELEGGHHAGPLFIIVKRRISERARRRESGGAEVWRKWMRTRPSEHDKAVFRDLVQLGRIYTEHTGIQHSVDHIVPLNHPIVCGFHRVANFDVKPLADNIKKSNSWWPGMPEQQAELFE